MGREVQTEKTGFLTSRISIIWTHRETEIDRQRQKAKLQPQPPTHPEGSGNGLQGSRAGAGSH